MIQRTAPVLQGENWKNEYAQAIKSVSQLLEFLQIPHCQRTEAIECSDFPLRVPLSYAKRMEKGKLDDPLLRQVLPTKQESSSAGAHDEYSLDPLMESNARLNTNLLQKYQGRVLLLTTAACPIHCRYCFRRHFPYHDDNVAENAGQYADALQQIKNDNSIREVILSGGDPLSLSDGRLAQLIRSLEEIQHLRYLRIHTRLPIVLPARVTPALLDIVQHGRLRKTVVVHCNHPHELSPEVSSCLQALSACGVTLFNQSVLLKGINDTPTCLMQLSQDLYDAGVTPYYLHMPDKVKGTAHFDVEQQQAVEIMKQLRSSLPGYLVPRLVRELPRHAFKVPVCD